MSFSRAFSDKEWSNILALCFAKGQKWPCTGFCGERSSSAGIKGWGSPNEMTMETKTINTCHPWSHGTQGHWQQVQTWSMGLLEPPSERRRSHQSRQSTHTTNTQRRNSHPVLTVQTQVSSCGLWTAGLQPGRGHECSCSLDCRAVRYSGQSCRGPGCAILDTRWNTATTWCVLSFSHSPLCGQKYTTKSVDKPTHI